MLTCEYLIFQQLDISGVGYLYNKLGRFINLRDRIVLVND